MQASNFEFKNRFWVIGLVFGLGFWAYSFDRTNAAIGLLEAIHGSKLDDSLQSQHKAQLIFAIGTLLVAAAAAFRTWATAYLKSDIVHDANVRTEGLVADGPYRHVRNPLYLANVLLAIGMGTMASRTGFFIIVVGMLIVTYRLIGFEERQLLGEQGERYDAYRQAVPRLWPSIRPRVPAGVTLPRWPQAWLGEAFSWGFALAIAIFTITLKINLAFIVCGVTLALYIIGTTIMAKRRKTAV